MKITWIYYKTLRKPSQELKKCGQSVLEFHNVRDGQVKYLVEGNDSQGISPLILLSFYIANTIVTHLQFEDCSIYTIVGVAGLHFETYSKNLTSSMANNCWVSQPIPSHPCHIDPVHHMGTELVGHYGLWNSLYISWYGSKWDWGPVCKTTNHARFWALSLDIAPIVYHLTWAQGMRYWPNLGHHHASPMPSRALLLLLPRIKDKGTKYWQPIP